MSGDARDQDIAKKAILQSLDAVAASWTEANDIHKKPGTAWLELVVAHALINEIDRHAVSFLEVADRFLELRTRELAVQSAGYEALVFALVSGQSLDEKALSKLRQAVARIRWAAHGGAL